MIPLRFGPPGRQLFGLFRQAASTAPPASGSPRPGVLLCGPWGQEAIRSQRLLRALSERLARMGFPVLRFDHLGTGDADGDDSHGNLSAWQDDVLLAHQQLMRLSGHERTVWIGLRLGASLAALASPRAAPAPELLVAWDPVHDGAHYLDALHTDNEAYLQEAYGQRWHQARKRLDALALQAPPTQAFGFALSPQLVAELGQLRATAWQHTRAGRVTLMAPAGDAGIAELSRAIAHAGLPQETLETADVINWASDEAMDTAIVPQGTMVQLSSQLRTWT